MRKGQVAYTREQVQHVYDVWEQGGMSVRAVAKATGLHYASVHRWLSDPATYDPYIDEVAIARALEGDRKVYDAFTVWERREFPHRIKDYAEAYRLERELGLGDTTLQTAWARAHGVYEYAAA